MEKYNSQVNISKYKCVIVRLRENVDFYFLVKQVHMEAFSKFLMEHYTNSISELLDALMTSKLNKVFLMISPSVIDLRNKINL